MPKEERPVELQPQNIPQEALATEHFVNLLTIDFMSVEPEMDLATTLEDILKENALSVPKKVSHEKIRAIQKELADLMAKWRTVRSGQLLEMDLEL